MTVRKLGPAVTTLPDTGIAVITLSEFRWTRCDIKSIALLPSVLAYQAAKRAGANDAIFVDKDETVNEATGANVFIVTDSRLRTPPTSTRILPGVTRDKILEESRAAGIETAEERITKSELYAAAEVFLTSTTAVLVVKVDGRQIGAGKTGPVSARVYEQFARTFIRP